MSAAVPPRERVAAAFLLVVLAIGSLALWTAIPALSLYTASQVTETLPAHFLVALPMTVISVILFARGLFWVNRLYLRVALGRRRAEEDDWDEDLDQPRWARGPLEPLLVVTLGLALVALFISFFFWAENPSLF